MANGYRPIFYGNYPIVIMYAIGLHIVWAIGLIADPSQAGWATAISAMIRLFGDAPLAVLGMLSVAIAATVGLFDVLRLRAILLMLPQQFLLYVSAFAAYQAVSSGRFADGVERSHWFIAVDQAPAILAAIGHTLAIIKIARTRA